MSTVRVEVPPPGTRPWEVRVTPYGNLIAVYAIREGNQHNGGARLYKPKNVYKAIRKYKKKADKLNAEESLVRNTLDALFQEQTQ